MWSLPLYVWPGRRCSSVVQRSCYCWKIWIFPVSPRLLTPSFHSCITTAVSTTGRRRLIGNRSSQSQSSIVDCGLPADIRSFDPRCPSTYVHTASRNAAMLDLRRRISVLVLNVIEDVGYFPLKRLQCLAELQHAYKQSQIHNKMKALPNNGIYISFSKSTPGW